MPAPPGQMVRDLAGWQAQQQDQNMMDQSPSTEPLPSDTPQPEEVDNSESKFGKSTFRKTPVSHGQNRARWKRRPWNVGKVSGRLTWLLHAKTSPSIPSKNSQSCGDPFRPPATSPRARPTNHGHGRRLCANASRVLLTPRIPYCVSEG